MSIITLADQILDDRKWRIYMGVILFVWFASSTYNHKKLQKRVESLEKKLDASTALTGDGPK